jgi:hypothetical protein
MNDKAQKASPWRLAVVFGASLVFVLGIPSLPGKNHLIYWCIAFLIEATLCATLLPFRKASS